MIKKYRIRKDIFDKIHNETEAYILGFMYNASKAVENFYKKLMRR